MLIKGSTFQEMLTKLGVILCSKASKVLLIFDNTQDENLAKEL
jgi:hypothetical protein